MQLVGVAQAVVEAGAFQDVERRLDVVHNRHEIALLPGHLGESEGSICLLRWVEHRDGALSAGHEEVA